MAGNEHMDKGADGGGGTRAPLAGVRVLDFASFIAGTYGASLLGDMGADVIKVEPLTGDLSRQWGPFLAGEGRFFIGWNRSKRGLALDLAAPRSRNILLRLVRGADVLIQNFRPGVAERLGMGWEAMHAVNPRLVYCASTGFGSRGPHGGRAAHDPILQSMSGSAVANIRFSAVVGIASAPFIDFQTAMLGVAGVLAALYERERTGVGRLVETSLLQGALSGQAHCFVKALDAQEEGPVGIYPYRLFNTRDGQIFVAAPTNKFWRILCEAVGLPDLAEAPISRTNTDRVTHAEELTARLQPRMLEKTTAEWEALLNARDVPCGPVRTFDDFLGHEQVEAMGMNPVVTHAKVGRVRVGGVPVTFDGEAAVPRRSAPLLGEHTEEILREIGLGGDEIAGLRAAKVIP